MPALVTAPAPLSPPEVLVDSSALPAVSGDVRLLLNEFLALLARDIQQQNFPIGRVEVRGTSDPEDDITQVLVRLWAVGVSDREARQYQGAFGSRVDEWVRSLSEDRKSLFAEKISFHMRRAAVSG